MAEVLNCQELLKRVDELKTEIETCEDLEGLRQVKDKIELSREDLKASEDDAKTSFVVRVGLPFIGAAALVGGFFGYYVVSDIINDGLTYLMKEIAPFIEPRVASAEIQRGITEKASETMLLSTIFGTAIPTTIAISAAYKVYGIFEYFHVSAGYRQTEHKFKELHDSCAQRIKDIYGI